MSNIATHATAARGNKLSYRIKEVMAMTGLGRTTIYRRIAAGELTARKDGTVTLIDADELHRYIDALPTVAQDEKPE